MLDLDFLRRVLPELADGIVFTLKLTALATGLGLTLGALLAGLRRGRRPILSRLAAIYIALINSVPLLLILFAVWVLGPAVAGWIAGAEWATLDPFLAALVAISLFEAARFASMIGAAPRLVSRGQALAGAALGMTSRQVKRSVIWPQMVRSLLPLILAETILVFQETSLVYLIAGSDFLGAAATVGGREGRLLEMYGAAAVGYLILSLAGRALIGALGNGEAPRVRS